MHGLRHDTSSSLTIILLKEKHTMFITLLLGNVRTGSFSDASEMIFILSLIV